MGLTLVADAEGLSTGACMGGGACAGTGVRPAPMSSTAFPRGLPVPPDPVIRGRVAATDRPGSRPRGADPDRPNRRRGSRTTMVMAVAMRTSPNPPRRPRAKGTRPRMVPSPIRRTSAWVARPATWKAFGMREQAPGSRASADQMVRRGGVADAEGFRVRPVASQRRRCWGSVPSCVGPRTAGAQVLG
jgi:hypothetical protein